MDTASRLIELAEDRLRVAEQLGCSVAGKVARIYACLDDDNCDGACELLEEIDALINEARSQTGVEGP